MIQLPEQRIERIIDDVLLREGGGAYTNHPADRGGPTRFGITEAKAREHRYFGPMPALPEQIARAIYRQDYIITPRFDAVLAIDPSVGVELIDTGVNMGTATATTFLQRWLNAFNVDSARYAELTVDGSVGDKTLDALRAFIRWRGPMGITALLRGLNSLQGAKYLTLSEANRSQRQFLFGWMINRVEMP